MGLEEIGDAVPVKFPNIPRSDQDVDSALPFEELVKAEGLEPGGQARCSFYADDVLFLRRRGRGR
jgi:hypothetical protein